MSEIIDFSEDTEEIIKKRIISILKNYQIDIDFVDGAIVTTKKEPPCAQ